MTVIYCILSTENQLNAYSKKQFYFHSQKLRYGETNRLLLTLLIPINLFPDCFLHLLFTIYALLLLTIMFLLCIWSTIIQVHHRIYLLVWTCLFCLLLQGVHNILICLIDHYPSSNPQIVYLFPNSSPANKCQKCSIAHKKVISILCLIIFANNVEQEIGFSAISSCKTEMCVWMYFGLMSNLKYSVILVLFQ